MPKEQGNWWDRNWKWLVPTGCLTIIVIPLLLIGGIVGFAFKAFGSSWPVEHGVERAGQHTQVVEALGEPIERGWWASGTIKYEGSSGYADVTVPISGPKGDARLYIIASRRAGASSRKLNEKWLLACAVSQRQ